MGKGSNPLLLCRGGGGPNTWQDRSLVSPRIKSKPLHRDPWALTMWLEPCPPARALLAQLRPVRFHSPAWLPTCRPDACCSVAFGASQLVPRRWVNSCSPLFPKRLCLWIVTDPIICRERVSGGPEIKHTQLECHPSPLPIISPQGSLLTSQNLFLLMPLWVQMGPYLRTETAVQRNNTCEVCRTAWGVCGAEETPARCVWWEIFCVFLFISFFTQSRVCFLFISLSPAFGLVYSNNSVANNHACQQYITYCT